MINHFRFDDVMTIRSYNNIFKIELHVDQFDVI